MFHAWQLTFIALPLILSAPVPNFSSLGSSFLSLNLTPADFMVSLYSVRENHIFFCMQILKADLTSKDITPSERSCNMSNGKEVVAWNFVKMLNGQSHFTPSSFFPSRLFLQCFLNRGKVSMVDRSSCRIRCRPTDLPMGKRTIKSANFDCFVTTLLFK